MLTQMTDVQSLIQAVDAADSSDALLDAVKALAQARNEAAISTLISVLSFNNPGAAIAAVDGLIALGEVTVPYLMKEIDQYNYGGRAWAIRVFAGIGEPSTLDLLLEAAKSDFALSVRRAAARGLGMILWHKLPQEEVIIAQNEVFKTLVFVCQDPEWVVRYAAVVGLELLMKRVAETQMTLSSQILEQIKKMAEQDSELAVCARGQLALQQTQWN
jgi:phycocyanobilin lyase beta subunit